MRSYKSSIVVLLGTLLLACGSGTSPTAAEEASAHASALNPAAAMSHAAYYIRGSWGDGDDSYAQLEVAFNDEAFAAAYPGFDGLERVYADIQGFGRWYLRYYGTMADGSDAYYSSMDDRDPAYPFVAAKGVQYGVETNVGDFPALVRARRSDWSLGFLEVVPRLVRAPAEVARAYVFKGTAKLKSGDAPVAFSKIHYDPVAMAAVLENEQLPPIELSSGRPYLAGARGDFRYGDPDSSGQEAVATASRDIQSGASLEPRISFRTVEGWWLEVVVETAQVNTLGSYTSTTGREGFEGLPPSLEWLADPWAKQPN